MRGFNPERASGANNYADGGVVSGIKRALGFDPERAARIAEAGGGVDGWPMLVRGEDKHGWMTRLV